MQGSKEILELLTKFKDTRLNLAIFLVSSALLYAIRIKLFELDAVSSTVLQGLIFVTSIRLVYGLIGLAFDFITNKQESKRKEADKIKEKELAIQDKEKQREKMIANFNELDVFQLYIVQELKRQNHISVMKGAPLFTLKNMGAIYTPAVGEKSESASLTEISKSILGDILWNEFDDLKFSAISRFVTGLQPEELKCFVEFLSSDKIKTTSRYNSQLHYKDSYYVFKKYNNTILFSQPQRGYDYTIDPIAKNVIESLYGEELQETHG